MMPEDTSFAWLEIKHRIVPHQPRLSGGASILVTCVWVDGEELTNIEKCRVSDITQLHMSTQKRGEYKLFTEIYADIQSSCWKPVTVQEMGNAVSWTLHEAMPGRTFDANERFVFESTQYQGAIHDAIADDLTALRAHTASQLRAMPYQNDVFFKELLNTSG